MKGILIGISIWILCGLITLIPCYYGNPYKKMSLADVTMITMSGAVGLLVTTSIVTFENITWDKCLLHCDK